MNVKERVKIFVEYEKMSVSAFEKSIKASNGYVNSISKSIGVDKIELILENFPNLNIEWLLTGKGEMLKNNKKNSLNDEKHTFEENLKSPGVELLQKDLEAAKATLGSQKDMIDLQKDFINKLKEDIQRLNTEIEILRGK